MNRLAVALVCAVAALFAASVAAAQTFRVAVFADVEHLATAPPTFAAAMAFAPDVAILAGDYDHRNPQTTASITAMHTDVVAATTAGLPAVPVLATWDDHDFCRNNASSACPTKALSLSLWPLMRPMCADNGLPLGIWQRCDFGFIDVFLLDARSNRKAVNGAQRTMLGATQESWLSARLAASTATWHVVVSSVTINSTVHSDADTWADYPTSLATLCATLPANTIVVSGDRHAFGIDAGVWSCRPELNVPRTTEDTFLPGSADKGTWSVAKSAAPHPAGFGAVTLTPTEATLAVYDTLGVERASLVVPAP